jgi:hypothetical protein
MSALEDPDRHPAKFTRRSETGSTCNFCFVTPKAGRYIPIEMAVETHSDLCLPRPESPVEYVLWWCRPATGIRTRV